jgi:hypothetical protein
MTAMEEQLLKLVQHWRRDAEQYKKQVEECRLASVPHDQMLSMMTCLRACAKELEGVLLRKPKPL